MGFRSDHMQMCSAALTQSNIRIQLGCLSNIFASLNQLKCEHHHTGIWLECHCGLTPVSVCKHRLTASRKGGATLI